MRVGPVEKPETRFGKWPREGEDAPRVSAARERSAAAVVLSKGSHDSLAERRPSLVAFLSASPLAGVELQIERDLTSPRELDL